MLKNDMYIVLSTDNNFVQHCSVALVSILKNNTDVHFYILTEGLSESNKKILYDLCVSNGGSIDFCIVDSSIASKLPMPDGDTFRHISVATYYRLFVSSLLPASVDRILYLDCDIVVRKSLSELWCTNLDGYAMGAVYQDDRQWVNPETYARLSIPQQYGYFNAGVLAINLKYWRENRVEERLLEFVNQRFADIKFHDQDTLNAILYDKVMMLDCKWNAMSYFLDGRIDKATSERCLEYKKQINEYGIKRDPSLVHYVSRPKPWEYSCNVPFVKDYYHYLSYTPFAGWKPKFAFSPLFEYHLKPFYKRVRHSIKVLIVGGKNNR